MASTSALFPGALHTLDILGIAALLIAAVLAVRCAISPLYHSSRTRRRHERRLWIAVAAVTLLVAAYQFLGVGRMVLLVAPWFAEMVSNHGQLIAQLYYVTIAIVFGVALLLFYAWVGGSLKRNRVAVIGVAVMLVALGVGVLEAADDARRTANGATRGWAGGMQVAGLLIGSFIVAISAIAYRQRGITQSRWRRRLAFVRGR